MSAPYQAVRAADTHFVVGANNDRLYNRLCAVIGRSDLLDDPRFATIALRLANREALIAELERSFAARDAEDWVERLLDVGVPAAPIYDYAQALENPHAEARGVLMDIDHPVEGRVRSMGFPVKLGGTPQQVRRPPPRLGEHNDEVLAEIGFDAEQRAALAAGR